MNRPGLLDLLKLSEATLLWRARTRVRPSVRDGAPGSVRTALAMSRDCCSESLQSARTGPPQVERGHVALARSRAGALVGE